MWVFNPHVEWAAVTPLEGQSPLVVDSNVPSVALPLQIVSRWRTHKFNRWCSIQLSEFALGNFFNVDELCRPSGREKLLRFAAMKRLNWHVEG